MTGVVGSRRGRGSVVTGLLVLSCGLILGLGAGEAHAADAELIVTYTTPTSLQVTLGNGTVVGTGTVIPAGSYTVTANDDPSTGDQNPNLTITGPSVNLSSNLTGMDGIDDPWTFGTYTFQTNSTYTVEDTSLGSSTLVTFTTSATATSSGGSSSSVGSVTGGSSSSSSSGSPSSSSSSKSTSSSSSTAAMMVGTLEGSVSASGKVTLSYHGKAVKSLKGGRYTLAIENHSKKAGLDLGELSKHSLTVSTAGGVGKSTRSVTLTAGRWFFDASIHGIRTDFSVVK